MVAETSPRKARIASRAPANQDALVEGALFEAASVGNAPVGNEQVEGSLVEGALVEGALVEGALVEGALVGGAFVEATLDKDTLVKDALPGHASVGDAAFEACHKVFETAELVEMILLKVCNPYDYLRSEISDHASNHEDSQDYSNGDSSSEDDDFDSDTDFDSIQEGHDNNNDVAGDTDADSPGQKEIHNDNGGHQWDDLDHDQKEFENMRTVLLSRRTSHSFRAIIDGSVRLQRALWFRSLFEEERASSAHRFEARLNPVFTTKRVPFRVYGPDPNNGLIVQLPSQATGTESWRRMLIVQATAPEMYRWTFWGSVLPFPGNVELKSRSDSTAGDVFEKADHIATRRNLAWKQRHPGTWAPWASH